VRRLAGVWLLGLLIGACATGERSRETAFLRDARECEEDADVQLRNAGRADHSIRFLFFQSCMMLRGWQVE